MEQNNLKVVAVVIAILVALIVVVVYFPAIRYYTRVALKAIKEYKNTVKADYNSRQI